MSQKSNRIRRLKHIEAFSAVISSGSISAAARELGVSQPAVSQLIKSLEDAIGAPLFIRRNGAIFPTGRAESLRDDALDLLTHLDRIQAQLNFKGTKLLSTIRLSASMTIVNELIPLLLTDIHEQHKHGKFYVSSVPLSEMIERLVQGNIDFAFHTRPMEHPSIHNLTLAEVSQVAVMSVDHPLAKKEKLHLEDLRGCKLISSTKNDPDYYYYYRLFSERRVPVDVVLQSPFAGLAINMVTPLMAISFNNILIAKFLCNKDPGLTWKLVTGVERTTPFILACTEWQNASETHKLLVSSFTRTIQENVTLENSNN